MALVSETRLVVDTGKAATSCAKSTPDNSCTSKEVYLYSKESAATPKDITVLKYQ